MSIVRALGFVILFCFLMQERVFSGATFFRPCSCPITNEDIIVDPDALLNVAQYSLAFFASTNKDIHAMVKSKQLDCGLMPCSQAQNTLSFIVDTIKTDKKLGRAHRILDKEFLEKNFTFIRWYGDHAAARGNHVCIPKWHDKGALVDGKIKLTSYAVFRRRGSYYKTAKRSCALYEIISDEFRDKLRLAFTKQEILAGALDGKEYKKHIRPLIWLSAADLEEALMQGSVIAVMPNGKKRLFNVYKSNGFEYDKKVANKENQKKYWFFQEIKENQRIPIGSFNGNQLVKFGGVLFAGDERNLGLGKIVALQYKNTKTKKNEFKLGVLADRGSAFSNNLYQLDLYSGIFNNTVEFKDFIAQFPPTVKAYILKKRSFLSVKR